MRHLPGVMNEHSVTAPSASPTTPNAAALPRSVLLVALIIIAFIGLFTLEISDSYFKHDGQIARSLFVLPVAILLLHGILTRRRWAWWSTRVLGLLGAGIYTFASVGVWIFFGRLPVGVRFWISIVGMTLCALILLAYLALGRRPARAYFQIQAMNSEH
jgi:hypothetical protein